MLIIGSKALVYHFPNIDRVTKDIDLIGYKSDVKYYINSLNPSTVKEGNGIYTLINIQNKTDFFNTNNVEILIADESESPRSLSYYFVDRRTSRGSYRYAT